MRAGTIVPTGIVTDNSTNGLFDKRLLERHAGEAGCQAQARLL